MADNTRIAFRPSGTDTTGRPPNTLPALRTYGTGTASMPYRTLRTLDVTHIHPRLVMVRPNHEIACRSDKVSVTVMICRQSSRKGRGCSDNREDVNRMPFRTLRPGCPLGTDPTMRTHSADMSLMSRITLVARDTLRASRSRSHRHGTRGTSTTRVAFRPLSTR